MAEIARMFAVLLGLVGLSGGLIATVKAGTEEGIEDQVLTYVKGPALVQIFPKATIDQSLAQRRCWVPEKHLLQYGKDKDFKRIFNIGNKPCHAHLIFFVWFFVFIEWI